MKFIVLFFCTVGSYLMLKYRRPIKEFTGDISFAEKFLGMGGTNTFIVILGILLFFGGLFYFTGSLQSILSAVFGRFF